MRNIDKLGVVSLDDSVQNDIQREVAELRKTRKRAITLAGGGPVVGLSIGALRRLAHEPDIDFDVWALSCIGAWLGVVYHQADKDPAIAALQGVEKKLRQVEACETFFRGLFRPDDIYSHYPTASAFGVDPITLMTAWAKYALDPKSYQHLVLPDAIMAACEQLLIFATQPSQWNRSNLKQVLHNQVAAVNPIFRWFYGMAFKSNFSGWITLHEPDSALLKGIDFDRLKAPGKPFIYHNAYNFTKRDLDLFCNRPHENPQARPDFKLGITSSTLCACSALPYLEAPVEIDGVSYCEGAMLETVNFRGIVEHNADLDEVWISRIVNYMQVKKPDNLYEALNNLIMLFAASTSEADVTLFKAEAEKYPGLKVYEIPIDIDGSHGSFDWSWGNLDRSMVHGEEGAAEAVSANNRDLENIVRARRALQPLAKSPALVD